MRNRKKLEFKTKRHVEKAKKKRYFLIFSLALLIFGVVSALVLLNSVNFDLSNLFEGREAQTSAGETTTKIEPVALSSANFLAMCVSDDAKSVRFIAVINADLGSKENRIRVAALSPQFVAKVDGRALTLEEHFRQGGVTQTLKAIENSSAISIERYACSTDSGFSSALKNIEKAKAGKFAMLIQETVDYRFKLHLNDKDKLDFNLFIPKGDKTFDAEMLLKYFRYLALASTENGVELQALTISNMLSFFINKTNFENGEELFGLLYNAMEQKNINITGFDFNKIKAKIENLLAQDDAIKFGVEQNFAKFVKSAATTTGEDAAS